MSEMNRLDTELKILMQYRYPRKQMVNHIYKYLLKNPLAWLPKSRVSIDVADLHDEAESIVSDYIKRNWWQYLVNNLMTAIGR